MSPDRLGEAELAARAGMTVEQVREMVRLDILTPENDLFRRGDVPRARAMADLVAKGIDLDAIAAAMASGHLTSGYLEIAGRKLPRSDRTFEEVAQELGITLETLQAMYVALGLPRPAGDEHVREEDLPMLRAIPVLLGAGVGEGDILRALRVYGDSARRAVRFESHLFHSIIEAPFRARLRDNEAYEAALRQVGVRMGHTGEQMLGWLFRRHAEAVHTEHQMEHVEAALEEAGLRQRSPRGIEAAVFADLSGYTALTEEAGDARAAQVSISLAQYVSEVGASHRGDVVKMLGDGVHFHFRDPDDAVRASLDIVEGVASRDLPPAHIGVNAGPMIYDEGDYFGRTVNIAARIAAQARAGQVFVGEDAHGAVAQSGYRLSPVGNFELKGIARPVMIYEALRARG